MAQFHLFPIQETLFKPFVLNKTTSLWHLFIETPLNETLPHTSEAVSAISRLHLQGKTFRLNETACSDDIFYSVHAPLDIDTRCKQHGLTLIHVEKIDFIAKTCKHNMYTDMFYFFIYFIVFFFIFRNIQVDISHIFFWYTLLFSFLMLYTHNR